MEKSPIRRALISVSNKEGVVEFAQTLQSHKIEILSTGGTARALTQGGVAVTAVSEYTGSPEIFDGRVKTLHPKIHGGLLFRRDHDGDIHESRDHSIAPIDLVVVNLYPFEKTVADPNVETNDAIENIDIGGPTMIRSAAKNHQYVTVVVEPTDYPRIAQQISREGGTDLSTRQDLAVKAFKHTSTYDSAIVTFFSDRYHV